MKQRIISAAIIIIMVCPFIILGNIPFLLLVTIASQIATYELLQYRPKIPKTIKVFTHMFILLLIIQNIIKIPVNILYELIILFYFITLLFTNNTSYHYKDAFYLIGLTIILGLLFHNFIIIRKMSLTIFIYLLLIAIFTDTFALLIGKKFGEHKLASKISPNKTIEGLIGGCLIATILASIYYQLLIHNYNIIIIFTMTFILSIIGQIGDLIKSQIKRYEKVKDFSNLIPGHGGVLDRLDSLIFITMFYIIIKTFI